MRSTAERPIPTEDDPVLDRMVVRLNFLRREKDILKAQQEHLDGEIDNLLTRMIKRMSVRDDDDDPTEGRPMPHDDPPPDPFRRGDRVEILIRDKYFGRRGTITEPHGKKKYFWWIQLDPKGAEQKGPLIYKAPSSLKLLL